eukprot:2966453-Amphidinium_carterae.1
MTEAPAETLNSIHGDHHDIYISDSLPFDELNTSTMRMPALSPGLEGFEHLYDINYSEQGRMAEIHVHFGGRGRRLNTPAYLGFAIHIPVSKTISTMRTQSITNCSKP